MKALYEKYLKTDMLPTIFCPGCGYGTVMSAFIRAIDSLNINQDDISLHGGVGCGCRLPQYFNCDISHGLHGRALSFAQGVKMARPEKQVVVFTGDGDNVGIGGNAFIHACRRNVDITVIQLSNLVYAMTGSQQSPMTPIGGITKTSPYGSAEPNFNLGKLSAAAGASYFARWTTANPVQLEKCLAEAISHRGLSVVEVISQCPTGAGRNMYGTDKGYEMLDMFRKIYHPAPKDASVYQDGSEYFLGCLFKEDRPTIQDYQDKWKEQAES